MHENLRIVLLSSAFNGLTQRAWLLLREAGYKVTFQLFTDGEDVITNIERIKPDIILCPFLKDRVPEKLWKNGKVPVVIIHPGIVGDKGASSLDWTIMNHKKRWGVTALEAVEEMDAGPIWSTHEFSVDYPVRKSALYNSKVSDAAMACIFDAVALFQKGKHPVAVSRLKDVKGNLQANMKQPERAFDWSEQTAEIVKKIDAAEGIPGVKAEIEGVQYFVYDCHPSERTGAAGKILAKRFGAILVGTGDKSTWIGSLKPVTDDKLLKFKYPSVDVMGEKLKALPDLSYPVGKDEAEGEYSPVSYYEQNEIGELTFDFYNGAMSTKHCNQATQALSFAKKQNTKVLIIKGGWNAFSNGIHLNTIEAAKNPREEAWANINAIDDLCLEILTTRQFVITAFTGSAGAGGVMMALAGDKVLAREGVVLNPHYKTMGLYGSEYWTYTLPMRVGQKLASELTQNCLPVSVERAFKIGLVDAIGPRCKNAFLNFVHEQAISQIKSGQTEKMLHYNADLAASCRKAELKEMEQDILHDRSGFDAKRRCFVLKNRASKTPERLVADWAR